MRRMISENEKKVLKNFAVNDNGTIVEIGGNVAFESIEQVGYMATSKKANVKNDSAFPTSFVLAENIEDVEGFSYDSAFPPTGAAEGKLKISPDVTSYFIVMIKGVVYHAERTNTNLYIIGENLIDNTAIMPIEETTNYKPFFTEEQYQEILDLIG